MYLPATVATVWPRRVRGRPGIAVSGGALEDARGSPAAVNVRGAMRRPDGELTGTMPDGERGGGGFCQNPEP